jgi:hypothetical protein
MGGANAGMIILSGAFCAGACCGALAVTLTSKTPRTKFLALKIFLVRIVVVPAV